MQQRPFDRPTVLLVDDDPDLREIYRINLENQGFNVVVAENGENALQVVREKQPDAILLDLQMPGKDGFDVLAELSADEKLKEIPVVILSNVDSEDAFKKVGQYHTRFYLVKALTTPEKTAKIVREALPGTEM